MLGEYRLTLPPDTYPLDDGRRADHVRWRRDALAEARRELRTGQMRTVASAGTSPWGFGGSRSCIPKLFHSHDCHGRIDPSWQEAYP